MTKKIVALTLIFAGQLASASQYNILIMNAEKESLQGRVSTTYIATDSGIMCKSFSWEDGLIIKTFEKSQTVSMTQKGLLSFNVPEQISECSAVQQSASSLHLKTKGSVFDIKNAGGIEIVTDDSVDENKVQTVECDNYLTNSGSVVSCRGAKIKFGPTLSARIQLKINQHDN